MPRLRYRSGGSWADSALSGAVDFNGGRLAFGPPESPGAIDEFLEFVSPPVPTRDWSDAGANVGTRFALSVPGSWIGIRIWRPLTEQAPGAEYVFGGNQGSGQLLTPNTPVVSDTRGDFVLVPFAASVPVTPGVDYLAAYSTNIYGFSRYSDTSPPPFASSSGRLYTDESVNAVAFYTYVKNEVPGSSSPNFHFNVSPIVRFS
jgi:hypothetical protein